MSDWDILAPVDDGENQGDQENDGDDGVFFGDGGDNDSFDNPDGSSQAQADHDDVEYNSGYSNFMGNEAQSFNPRMCDHSKQKDLFGSPSNGYVDGKVQFQTQQQKEWQPQQSKPYQPPQGRSNVYKDMPNSYTSRKIHDSPEFAACKTSKRRGRSRGPRGGGHRMMSDSDSAMSYVPHELLEEGFDERVYIEFHDAALQQRAELGIGKSAEMNSLFYFWCYYLRGHFDQSMYDEFLEIARQDASQNSHYGIECYFRLCSYGLEQRWDPQVFAQFQDEALVDYRKGSTYGLEKVKGFLDNQKYDFEIKPTPEMEAALSKFPTIESFKQSRNNNNNQSAHYPRDRKPQFDDSRVTEARSIPKQRFMNSNPNEGNWLQSPNNNNRQRRGSNQRGGRDSNFSRQRGGNQNRNKQYRHKNDEPHEWTFGRMQPSSAPKPDNMNINDPNH